MRVLFVLRTSGFDRNYEALLRELLRRGHRVDVAVELVKGGGGVRSAIFDALVAEHPGRVGVRVLPERREWWLGPLTAVRHALDYLRYLEPEYRDAHKPRARARSRVSRVLLAALWPWRRRPRRAAALLGRLEARAPRSRHCEAVLEELRPDVLIVAPLVGLGSPQTDWLRSARRLGIASVLPVASWDNLTLKGMLRTAPDRLVVWNEAQAGEAERLHGVPPDRIVVSGAHTYDHWFAWDEQEADRPAFGRRVGLGLDRRPMVLYTCSSQFIAPAEREFVREWLSRLREQPDRDLAAVAVLIRPHPQYVAGWARMELGDPLAAVWPREGATPTDPESKRDYHDSIHHAFAVVGINTSALIETAIVGRPVLTVLDERFAGTQGGTLHFAHLAGSGEDGLLTVAHGWDEHFAQLGAALRDPAAARPRIERFLGSFVRPRGVAHAAAPHAADAVESAANRC